MLAWHWGDVLLEQDDGPIRTLKAMRYHREQVPRGPRADAMMKSIKFQPSTETTHSPSTHNALSLLPDQSRLESPSAKAAHDPTACGDLARLAAKLVLGILDAPTPAANQGCVDLIDDGGADSRAILIRIATNPT